MKLSHEFEVTVSRINEGRYQEPYETFHAVSVSVGPDGTLHISGPTSGKSLSAGLWDSFELKRRTTASKEGE